MILIKNVSKTYKSGDYSINILVDVTFSIGKGKWISIIGPSGSGKSTLLNLIGAMDIPDKGEVIINGLSTTNTTVKNIQEIRRNTVGFIFQDFRLLPQYNIMDNVCLPQLPYQNKNKLIERASYLIESVGLSHRCNHLPNELSGGEKQRAAIARALINKPDIIICDEPTGNLDSENRDLILDIISNLHENGHTIVMATHDKEVASRGEMEIYIKDGCVKSEVII